MGLHSFDIIYGTQARVYVQPSGGGAAASATEYSGEITELSMSGGDRPVEEVKCLHSTEILKQMPTEPMEVELTMLKTDLDMAEAVMGGSDVQAGTVPFAVTGDSLRRKHRVWLEASGDDADSAKIRLLWNDAYGVNIGKSVNAEGHMEETIRFRCSASDYKEEWTGSYTTNAISTLPTY